VKSFPAAFTTQKNTKAGAKPVWILKITVNAVDYYLADDAFTITNWGGNTITTKAWVQSWGQVREGLSGAINEIRLADMSVTCLVDPDEATNMATLATGSHPLEKSACSLYLWFHGLDASTAPPQEMLRGYIKDPVELPDEQTVVLGIEDETTRLFQRFIGTEIDLTTYANADPDDVGKIIPLPYGVVRNVPARATVAGLLTTLKADITAGATTCYAARSDGIVANTTKFKIGSEIVKVTAINGTTKELTISRAQDSTSAAAHSAGDRMYEVDIDPFVFVVSGHALTSIDKVICRAGDIDVDVTDQCTRYTGQGGSQYSTYGAKAVITVTQAQAAVIRGRVAKGVDNTLGINNPNHDHSYNETRGQIANNLPASDGPDATASATPNYPSLSGVIEQTNHYVFSWGGGTLNSQIWIGGVRQTQFDGYGSGINQTWEGTTSGSTVPTITHYPETGNSATVTISKATREAVFANDSGSVAQASALTGSINSVADAMLGGTLHADVTAPDTDPDDVIGDLLNTWCGISSVSLVGSLSATYKFNGVVLEKTPAMQILSKLAWQCRSWFRVNAGTAELIVRPDSPSSDKTIAAVRLEGGTKVWSRRKTGGDEVINKIIAKYDRDWTKPAGDDAYRNSLTVSDATSITNFGTLERPEMFLFDFVTSETLADTLADFYLATYKDRRWRHEFDVMLDQCELEFADDVTLGFDGNKVGTIVEVGFSPGDIDRMDVIRLIVEV
jgi:hypothetical protein